MRAMSAMGGCCTHPVRLTMARASIGAPQFEQLTPEESPGSRQYRQV